MIDKILTPDLSKKTPESEKFFDGMKDTIRKTLSWQMPKIEGQKNIQDEYLERFLEITQKIEELKKEDLSPQGIEFLTLIERYYYVVAHKTELKPEDYKAYLRITRDDLCVFYLGRMLCNDYERNPIGIPISDIFSICSFIGKKFKNDDGKIDWVEYFHEYVEGKKTRLSFLIDEAKKINPDFKKKQIDIPLFLKIFDCNDEISKDLFTYILIEKLGFTKEEVSNINDRYLV